MALELTLEQAIAGKATRIKSKDYYSTEAYITPFLERMSKYTNDFRIQGVLADQVSLTPEGEINLEDTVYNRIWIQAVMPSDMCFENHDEVVGMIYGLDVRKPIVKIYRGQLNRACTNLCIFQNSFLDVQELEPESAINYKPIDRIMSQTCQIKNILTRLKETEVPYSEERINEDLGDWIRKSMHYSTSNVAGKVKVAASTAIDAYKLLYEKEDSPYYVPVGTDTDLFNVYNAFTQVLTDGTKKDIVGIAEKTILVGNILGI